MPFVFQDDLSRREAIGLIAAAGGIAAAPASALSLPEGIEPFKVAVPPSAIDELRLRLRLTRLPSRETAPGWVQGVPLDKAVALLAYWRDHYDWRRCERRLNNFPQFRTVIDGVAIHFLHVRSRHANALPMVMTHGWPGSVIEFLDVIGPLTDPTAHGGKAEDAFHLVIPSHPGFAWSDKPTATGWTIGRTAAVWTVLMQRLGYDRWVAQGGDWGSGVTHALAHQRPPGLLAAHVNLPFVIPETLPPGSTMDEVTAFIALDRLMNDGFSYFRQQGTRPQTLAYALADSPAGQAMWIYEKFQAWTDNHGQAEDALSLDQMLDDISIYWFTNAGASSARIYWENSAHNGAAPRRNFDAGRIDLPMAATVFPREYYRAPKAWAEARWPNLLYWGEAERGGHFAAFEQPAIFTREVRSAFRSIQRS